MLIKGTLLFFAFGILCLLIVLGLEYFLWLNSTGRLFLFLFFIGVEGFLLFNFIAVPLFYLFKLKRGITNKEASLLIGKHFPEVGDKLYNLLDLAEDESRSELLLASIEQRSKNLSAVPFARAVDLRENIKYLKYLLGPGLVFGLIWISGDLVSFFHSFDRMVHYDLAYEQPAPFTFTLLSSDLSVLDDKSYTILVDTEGTVRPASVYININGKLSLLQESNGVFSHTVKPPLKSFKFSFSANDVVSKEYELKVLKTPVIQDFIMELNFPNYTNRPSEVLKGTGNANFPEGTEVSWKIRGQNTGTINLVSRDTTFTFVPKDSLFVLSKSIYTDFQYELLTSNRNIKNYERLEFRFEVIKDAYPKIKVDQVRDSLNPNISYYLGEASDDYELSSIKLVYFPTEDPERQQILSLVETASNFNKFYYTFPSGLNLKTDTDYSFYFQATDNDGIRGGKTSKSKVFSLTLLSDDQLRNRELDMQGTIIGGMDESLEKFKEQEQVLKEINKSQKEKSQLNFNDQSQIKNFLKKQRQQEGMMEKFSKQLKENLNRVETSNRDNRLLQERLERQEIEARKNQKLLEELQKIATKIDKEELAKRLEELGKKQRNSERGLEQLLELTKRYYVSEKAAQLAKDLAKMAERQEILSELKIGKDFSEKEQKKLNVDFKEFSDQMRELERDNEVLKKPMDFKGDLLKEQSIKDDQQEALEEINKHQGIENASDNKEQEKSGDKAKQKQKSAAEKMKEMAEDLKQNSAAGSSGSSVAEDAEMLRQVLDNLIIFSFRQENLYDNMNDVDVDISHFSTTVRKQQELRRLFEHVDDSLFALSLRQAELSELVNEQITEVYFNIDRSLERIADGQIDRGASHQKYVLNASNILADFLARMLDNMQQSMKMGQGKGQSQDFQLADIIKKQGELKEKMEGMRQSGKGKPKHGEGEGSNGNGKKEGKKGDGGEGDRGKEGNGEGAGKLGQEGKGASGSQEGGLTGPGENELKEMYEIYKQQQMLRDKLELQLNDMIESSDRKLGEKLVRQMEDFQNDLLENGVTQSGLEKMNTIEYELLKLENAAMKQGKKNERESNSNLKEYQNPILVRPEFLKNYRKEIEILNREALPLRPNFQDRVKEYFRNND
tara:strand:+ start:120015 stop:123389 length:3375 start_codon:yes stop_codon:yes gene_type:complete